MLDACDKEQPTVEPNAAGSEDLQSRGSIQYTTRVKPDAESNQYYAYNNEPLRNYIDPRTNTKDHSTSSSNNNNELPSIPIALEENLKNDFHKSSPPPSPIQREHFTSNNNNDDRYRFRPNASQQNFTMYVYPTSNHTYGNVPFYMPTGHYGSPRPVNPPAIYNNYAFASNNNDYRPVRHPAIQPNYHAQPTVINAVDHRGRPVQTPVFNPKQQMMHVPAKHGYHRTTTGTRPSSNGAHHSVVYKKPIYKLNPQPVVPIPVAASHYGPAMPEPLVSQPVFPAVYPGHFQSPPPFLQPQHSPSMSQSVSVSYSSSAKHLHQRPLSPIQNRQETVGRGNQFQGGFNPDTVVVEGGFRPIVPGGSSVFQKRSDHEENDDADAATTTEPVVHHHEKKTSKKLISRKPAHAKHVDEQQQQQQLQLLDANVVITTEHHNGNPTVTENAEGSKQTADNIRR